MLSSLFGDLNPHWGPARKTPRETEDASFAATAILESLASEVTDRGQVIDSHLRDLVVTGSPAQAIRDHFAATRSDLDTATKLITLLDPTAVWASAVIKALSDASGRPIERLHLRENGTLRTLAMIERTTLERRADEPLRIYHADVRAPGAANAAIPVALMERAHMTAVIVGAMAPSAIDELLETLQHVVNQPQWRCPTLLFLLPPQAVWIANKISGLRWPQRLRVHLLNESLVSASTVWNTLLGVWNRVKAEPALPVQTPNPQTGLERSFKVSEFERSMTGTLPDLPVPPAAGAAISSELSSTFSPATHPPSAYLHTRPPLPTRTATPGLAPSQPPRTAPRTVPGALQDVPPPQLGSAHHDRPPLEAVQAEQVLAAIRAIEGVLGCAVVDATTGHILASAVDSHFDLLPWQVEPAAMASTQLFRAHRLAAREMGQDSPVDEILATVGERHLVIRGVTRHRGLFVFAVIDRMRCNISLARYRVMEAEQRLT